MSLQGKWRIVQMPEFEAGYPDMVKPSRILFKGKPDHLDRVPNTDATSFPVVTEPSLYAQPFQPAVERIGRIVDLQHAARRSRA